MKCIHDLKRLRGQLKDIGLPRMLVDEAMGLHKAGVCTVKPPVDLVNRCVEKCTPPLTEWKPSRSKRWLAMTRGYFKRLIGGKE